MKSDIKQAADLNFQGILRLSYGDVSSAEVCFRNALDILIPYAVQFMNDHYDKNIIDSESFLPPSSKRSLAPLADMGRQISAMPLPRHDHHGTLTNEDCCYSNALTFHTNDWSVYDYSPRELSIYCAVIFFNLALLHHRQAQFSDDGDLKKALQHYDMVSRLLAATISSRQSHFKCWKVVAAALHNQAHVLYELGNLTDARLILNVVLAVLARTNERLPDYNDYTVEKLFFKIQLAADPKHAAAA